MADFIDNLSVSDTERAKLRALGVRTPLAILSMRKAAAKAFDDHFGAERAEAIATELKGLLSEVELETLNQPMRAGGYLGARLDLPPKG